MPTQTLHQGGLRPARIPAIAVVHPGLQVHSISAPATDRRLSLLMSAALYCAFAAAAVLAAKAAPALHTRKVTADPPVVVVELRPPGAASRPAAPPPVRTPSTQVAIHSAVAPTLTEPQPVVNPDATPTSLGTTDLSSQIATATTRPGSGPYTNGAPGGGGDPSSPAMNQPVEVSFQSVSVLRQIQPIYPSLARVARKEGDVVLLMTINEFGVPTEVKMDSGDAVFRNDAIRAAQQWRFTPAHMDGRPHSARFRLTLQFRLRG